MAKAKAGLSLGIGTDMVRIERIRKLKDGLDSAFLRRGFTAEEQKEALTTNDPFLYYAGRFAVKEAVYKAVAHLSEIELDLRTIETLKRADGSPKVTIDGELKKVLDDIGADDVFVSISNEGEYAIAVAQAIRYY